MSAGGIRRAVILAAGQSRRLDELNLGQPKPALEVAGKPLLIHHLERCARQGIEEVYINLHHMPERIRALAGDGSRWNLKITYHVEPLLLGTAGGVKSFSRDLRQGPFFVLYGDNYCTFSLDEIARGHFAAVPAPAMTVALFDKPDVSASGVAVCDEAGLIESFVEKPAPGTTTSHWVNAGVYVMQPELLDLIPEGPCDFGHEIIPAFLRAGQRVLGVKTRGRVIAVDTPELLRQAQDEDIAAGS